MAKPFGQREDHDGSTVKDRTGRHAVERRQHLRQAVASPLRLGQDTMPRLAVSAFGPGEDPIPHKSAEKTLCGREGCRVVQCGVRKQGTELNLRYCEIPDVLIGTMEGFRPASQCRGHFPSFRRRRQT